MVAGQAHAPVYEGLVVAATSLTKKIARRSGPSNYVAEADKMCLEVLRVCRLPPA